MSDDVIQMFSYREEAARQTRQVKRGREVFQEGGRCCSNGRQTCSKETKGITEVRPWKRKMKRQRQKQLRLSKFLTKCSR